MNILARGFVALALTLSFLLGVITPSVLAQAPPAENPLDGSIGIEGIVSGDPPTQAPTITFPTDGTTSNDAVVTVTGICQNGYIVKVFKNNVFGGSTVCVNGSYSIQINLFSGRNELVARMYDDLDQAGPDSNVVVIDLSVAQFGTANRVSLTSNYAKRGAAPGATLTWPITLSGGTGPYAISIDWGDGKPAQIMSRDAPGNFEGTHIYDSAGVYNIVVRAVDSNDQVAFLQLVGVGNGEIAQTDGQDTPQAEQEPEVRTIWWPAIVAIPLIAAAYWLGKKSALATLRKRLGRK